MLNYYYIIIIWSCSELTNFRMKIHKKFTWFVDSSFMQQVFFATYLRQKLILFYQIALQRIWLLDSSQDLFILAFTTFISLVTKIWVDRVFRSFLQNSLRFFLNFWNVLNAFIFFLIGTIFIIDYFGFDLWVIMAGHIDLVSILFNMFACFIYFNFLVAKIMM